MSWDFLTEINAPNPGVYSGISNDDYHGGAGISKSGLDLIRRSPMHYKAVIDNPEQRESTPAQAFGTAFHALILEPDVFAVEYVQSPKFDRRTKQGKADAEAFAAQHEGKTPLNDDDWERLHAMRAAVMAHPMAAKLLDYSKGVTEQSVYWNDPATGELCRCRPDWWRQDLGIILDVKTAEDASAEEFARSLLNWRYHVQHPFYMDGIEHATGIKPRAFLFLVVEKKAPHAVAIYQLDDESVEQGRIEYRQDLELYAQCKQSGQWPGYGERIQPISLPEWYLIRKQREE